MKRIVFLSIIFITSIIAQVAAKDFYVSPRGNDSNNGSINAPFSTIEKAKLTVRELIKNGLSEDVHVYLLEGTHVINETVVFGLDDSPSKYTVTYEAFDSQKVIISSGQSVKGWKKARAIEGMPANALGNVWVADMPANLTTFRTLYDADIRLTRAKSEKFQMPPNKKIRRADSQNTYYNKDRIHLRMFPFTNQIKDWDNLSDVEVFFNPVPWNLNFIQLESVDMENKIAYMAFEANALPFSSKKHRFGWVENIIDYLDEPGEWCVNTKTRKIYYWPKNGTPSENIVAPKLMEYFKVEGKIQYDLPNDIPAGNINFKGLTFSHGDRTVW